MRGSRKFCQRGSNDNNFIFSFFFIREEGVVITLLAGHDRPASETPFKWRFTGRPIWPNIECYLGSFVIFQGIQTSFAKKPYIFCDFSRGSERPVPPLDPRMGSEQKTMPRVPFDSCTHAPLKTGFSRVRKVVVLYKCAGHFFLNFI